MTFESKTPWRGKRIVKILIVQGKRKTSRDQDKISVQATKTQ